MPSIDEEKLRMHGMLSTSLEKIMNITNDPYLLKKVSQNAYKWVKESLGVAKTLEAWERLFEELC